MRFVAPRRDRWVSLRDPRAWQAFWAVGERFLAEHLGGRFEASHGELAVAGVEVRSGAAYVPGLAGPGQRRATSH